MATITGTLNKRGKVNKAWKSRFFVLNGSVLTYFTESGGPLKGTLNVAGANVAEVDDTPGRRFVLSITAHSGTTVLLEAPSEAVRLDWFDSLATAAEDAVIVEGELDKYHKWRKRWSPRWFILDTTHLRWYQKRGGKFLGEVKAEALFGTLVAHPTHHYVFSLAAAGKQMLVKASTANAARDWLSSIKQARSNAVGLGKKFREEHEARSERRKIEAKAKKAEAKAKTKAKAKAEQPGDSKGELDHGNGQAVTPGSDGDSSLASDEEEGAGLEGFGLEEMDLSQFLQANLDDVGDDADDGSSSSEASASDEWDDLRAGRKRGHGTPRASPLGRRPTVRSTPRKSPASSASGGGEDGGAGSGEQSDSSIDDEDGDGIHPNGLRVIHRPADDCFSIKLTLVLAKRRDEPPDLPKLNHWQNRRCAWCRRTQTSGFVGRGTWSYYCTYTELMYCKVCYGSFKQVIPWRVVHKSDTKKYPVCKIAYQYLSMVLSAGVIDLLKYNSRHWATDESWQDLVEMRKKLIEAKDSAHQTKGLEKLEELLTNRSHFHMNTNMVSTMDVIALLNGTLLEPFSHVLEEFESFARVYPRRAAPVEAPPQEPEAKKRGLLSIFARKKKGKSSIAGAGAGAGAGSAAQARATGGRRALNLLSDALPYSGFMYKRGVRNTAWQKRWISLETSECVWSKDRFGKAKGKLTLSGDSTVKVMDRRAMLVLEPKKKLRPRKRVIRIRFKQAGRDVYLQALSDDALAEWIENFEAHIDAARAQDGLVAADGDSGGDASSSEEESKSKSRKTSKNQKRKQTKEGKKKKKKSGADERSSDDGAHSDAQGGSSDGSAASADDAHRSRREASNKRAAAMADARNRAKGRALAVKPKGSPSSAKTASGRRRVKRASDHADGGWTEEAEADRRESLAALLSHQPRRPSRRSAVN